MGAVYSLELYRRTRSLAYAANPKETVTVYLPTSPEDEPKKYWVKIKPKLNFGDAQYRLSKTMQIDMDLASAQDGGDPEMKADYQAHAMNQATLERAIMDWNLTEPIIDEAGNPVLDEDGTPREKPMDLTPENIQRLWEEDSEHILGEIRARNPTKSRKQKNG